MLCRAQGSLTAVPAVPALHFPNASRKPERNDSHRKAGRREGRGRSDTGDSEGNLSEHGDGDRVRESNCYRIPLFVGSRRHVI